MRRLHHSTILVFMGMLCALPAAAQTGVAESEVPWLRIGVHAGLQTGVLRYSIVPYLGEYQAVTDACTVLGVDMQFRIDERWFLQAEITHRKDAWSLSQAGDPSIHIGRAAATDVDFPFLLSYRPPLPAVPPYVAAGPQIQLSSHNDDAYTVRYTRFTERNGWVENSRSFDHPPLRAALVAELGLELPLQSSVNLIMALRHTLPLSRPVEEDVFTLRDFSYWRFRTGLLIAL